MKCLVVCQTEIVARMLQTALQPGFPVQYLVESRTLARRLHDGGLDVIAGDPRRTDTYLKVDLDPTTCVLLEDALRPGLRRTIAAIRDAGGTLVYVLATNTAAARREDEVRAAFPEVTYLSLAELFRPISDDLFEVCEKFQGLKVAEKAEA